MASTCCCMCDAGQRISGSNSRLLLEGVHCEISAYGKRLLVNVCNAGQGFSWQQQQVAHNCVQCKIELLCKRRPRLAGACVTYHNRV
jgi:hypothetical protein